jgi:methionyl aminopeptidase
VEREIVRRGGKPAFPCGLGVDEVTAHYAPLGDDKRVIEEKEVVKVDLGVHIDGYVADTATTMTFNPELQPLLDATERALSSAIAVLKKDPRVGEVGRAVHKEAKDHGFKTISNLSGHTVDRYIVHAGKSIPNLFMPNQPALKRNEVFAVEPFLTLGNAAGYVVDSAQETIFSLLSQRRLGMNELDDAVRLIWEERRTLPFTPRWFSEHYKEGKLRELLHKLEDRKVVRSYPTLVEASGKPVAQFEHTMALEETGLQILT